MQSRPSPARSSADDIARLRRRESDARLCAGICTLHVIGTIFVALVLIGAGSLVWRGGRGWLRAESIADLVCTDGSWTVCALCVAAAPILFVVWQRRAISYGRAAGMLVCASAAAGISIELARLECDSTTDVDG